MRTWLVLALVSSASLLAPTAQVDAADLWRVDVTFMINDGFPDAGEQRQLVGTLGFDPATTTVTDLDLAFLGEPAPLVYTLDSVARVAQGTNSLRVNLVAAPWSATATPPADPLGLGTLLLNFAPSLDPTPGVATVSGSFGYCANVASSGVGCSGFPTRGLTEPDAANTATLVPLPMSGPLLLGAIGALALRWRRVRQRG